MIQLSGAGKRYGHKLLFEDTDWLITAESRIGLVGANGTGKSTVMKILAGLESVDYGSISRAKGISAGYLPQDGLALSGRSIFAECMSVFDDLHAMEKEMESLTASMSELDHASAEYASVAERYQKLEHEFTARDGYSLEAEVGKVLMGLGFKRDDLFTFFVDELGYKVFLVKDFLEKRAALDLTGFQRAAVYPFQAFNFLAIPNAITH